MTSGIISLQRETASFKAGYGLLQHDLPALLNRLFLLHPDEKKYFNSLKYNRRRQSYLLGRMACKQALSRVTAQQANTVFVDSGVFQFPVVKHVRDLNIQVSISHCESIGLALAFPEAHPMGIDIEKIDESKTDAIESQMTAKEKAMIPGITLPLNTAYTMFWTIKEGLSKILKTGLMTDFKFFEVNVLTPNGNCYESAFVHHGQYKAISYVLNNYVCSIVLPRNTRADLDAFYASAYKIIAC